MQYEERIGREALLWVLLPENFEDQQKRFEPIDPTLYTVIIYTGVGYKMRDVELIRSVDAAIFIRGRSEPHWSWLLPLT